MSLFDKDLVTKEVPDYQEEYSQLWSKIVFCGELPEDSDISNPKFIQYGYNIILDTETYKLYIIKPQTFAY